MTKIFKQLGRHWAACLVVIALLIVQAYCDLSLPDYTSKIVDTGIQQGGIESPVPDTVRSTTLQALELLMSEDDAALADEAYTAPDADGVRTLNPDADTAALENAFCCTWPRRRMPPLPPVPPTPWSPRPMTSTPSLRSWPPRPGPPAHGKCCRAS